MTHLPGFCVPEPLGSRNYFKNRGLGVHRFVISRIKLLVARFKTPARRLSTEIKNQFSEWDAKEKPGFTHLADINQDLILKCSKLQSEIEKLKEENSRIRQDCYHEAMEQFRPIVTSQYAELIKMAAKFNMYQYNINKTLQKSIQNVRIGFIE